MLGRLLERRDRATFLTASVEGKVSLLVRLMDKRSTQKR